MFERLISNENLFAAWREFRHGKMAKEDVLAFAERFEARLFALRDDLASGRYRHGQYTKFFIHDPKQRRIAKGCVRDRVLHHAVCRVLTPLFEPSFIFDSYSSRRGKGTHRANERFRRLAWRLSRNRTRTVWALKCDVRKFFDSIDHGVLLEICARRVSDTRMMALLGNIVGSFASSPGKGLPLGNLTSQLLANVYMDRLDQFAKRGLRLRCYLRYTDDFVMLSRDRAELERALPPIREFLARELRLELHPRKVTFRKWHQGVDFLGHVHFPHHSVIRTRTKQRMFRKLGKVAEEHRRGLIEKDALVSARQSYLGVLSHARSRGVARRLRQSFPTDGEISPLRDLRTGERDDAPAQQEPVAHAAQQLALF